MMKELRAAHDERTPSCTQWSTALAKDSAFPASPEAASRRSGLIRRKPPAVLLSEGASWCFMCPRGSMPTIVGTRFVLESCEMARIKSRGAKRRMVSSDVFPFEGPLKIHNVRSPG